MEKQSTTKKTISITQLKPGMHVVGLDRSWLRTPFLFHKKAIKSVDEIEVLRKGGILEVIIDTALGADIEVPPPAAPRSPEPTIVETESTANTDAAASQARLYETTLLPLVKEIQVARTVREQALEDAQAVFNGVGRGSPLNSPIARKVVTSLLESVTRSPEANLLLTQMRHYRDDQFTHGVNVCVIALAVAMVEEFDEVISPFGLGALLHDVGQTRLPRDLMRKKGPLTDAERTIIEGHPDLGMKILQESGNFAELTRRIVAEHHERVNGSGYPLHRCGEQVSKFSQVVAIVDVYDDMVVGRDQAPLSPVDAFKQLHRDCKAGIFDDALVAKVTRCLGTYPVGSLVELSSGERGVVIGANRADSSHPTVRIIASRSGIDLPHGPVVNLAQEDPRFGKRHISRALNPMKEQVDLLSYLRLSPAVAAR